MASLASGNDSFLLLSKRGTCTMISACTHAHENARTHTRTHPKVLSPVQGLKGGSGQASYIYPLPGTREATAISTSQVCVPGPVPCTCSTRGSFQALLGGGASLLTSHSRYYWLTFSRIREVQTEEPRTTEGGRTFPSGGYIVRSSCPTSVPKSS